MATVLTDQPWQYRAVRPGGATAWQASLIDTLHQVTPLATPLDWFGTWRVWRGDDRKSPFLSEAEPAERGSTIAPAPQGVIDFTQHLGPAKNGRTAYATTTVSLDRAMPVTLHVSGDWWWQVWINGRSVLDTLSGGNLAPLTGKARAITLPLTAGEHRVTARVISGNGGWGLAAEAQAAGLAPAADFAVEVRKMFHVEHRPAALTFTGSEPTRVRLNGEPLPPVRPGVICTELTGLSVDLLRPGENELLLRWDEAESQRGAAVATLQVFPQSGDAKQLRPDATLIGLADHDVAIDLGPTLGSVSSNGASLACRLNLPAPLRWTIGEQQIDSPAQLLHRLRADQLEAGRTYDYRLSSAGKSLAQGNVRTLESDRALIAICADAGPLPAVWARVSQAVAEQSPDFCVFTGDLVSHGRREASWRPEFFEPARTLLSRVPIYPVIGNHDDNSPLLDELFITPGGRNWQQRAGTALLIGIDGAGDWSVGSERYQWLQHTLREAASSAEASLAPSRKPRFIFLFNHYPAWSSGPHLRAGADGLPVEQVCRTARDLILPLAKAHGVTAIFNGHDHCYERSELPGAPTLITSGGAGAFLYEKGENLQQNPYSRVFASTHHYCLLSVGEKACELVARTVAGEVIDRVRWTASKPVG